MQVEVVVFLLVRRYCYSSLSLRRFEDLVDVVV